LSHRDLADPLILAFITSCDTDVCGLVSSTFLTEKPANQPRNSTQHTFHNRKLFG